ncbi:hypothetical protein Vadar_020137 [Vaccinium darrowii]|uniref:Uncharacterized protein n=1 Tax=Vaccinium darrowii TaxID=229202 RepID=A0ACB7ZCK3_9ERIC|nr:hypothetical protein Vadar_020137 [Vaccinium darrowii]
MGNSHAQRHGERQRQYSFVSSLPSRLKISSSTVNSPQPVCRFRHCFPKTIKRATKQREMRNQLCSNQEEEYETAQVASYCWWRLVAKFEECAKLKSEMPLDLSKITPRLKVLREMERLALVAPEGLDDLRHKLFAYRCGDFWVPTGGFKKEETDIPPVNTILLVGFHNAGKSSLVNLMYSVFGRSGLVPFAQTTSEFGRTTMSMEEHNVLRSMRSGFCVYDTWGFDYDQADECVKEFSEWVTDGVHHKQVCKQPGDSELREEELGVPSFRSFSKFAKRRVNCVMVVANVSEICKASKAGDKKPLEAIKALFCSPALRNCKPILILTHGDKLSTEERIDSRLKICEHLGISETTGVYDIVCLTEYGFLADESDPVTAYALTESIYRALLISDGSHLPKRNFGDCAFLILSWLMCFLGAVFALLAHFFSKIGRKRIRTL